VRLDPRLSSSVPSPTPQLARDPWRLFFPLGAVLAWAGVLHWLLFALGATGEYRAVFHATAQIQGFMTCIAAGFLFTFVPRRTGGDSPVRWQLAGAAVGPISATLSAWLGHWALAQALWGAGAVIVAAFVVRRILPAEGARRLPGVFVWVPIALVAAAVSAVLVAIAAVLGPREAPELWQLGRGWLLQGLVTGLVLGVGGTMLPTLTRLEPAPDAGPHGASSRLAHAVAAVLFLASFPVEVVWDVRQGFALRALVAGGVLVATARLWRPPTAPGLHRRLIWLSAWLLPAGYALAALDPDLRTAALHVVFIGSFATMALAVSLHVALSHGGHPERLSGSPWQVWVMGALLLVATATRLLVGADPARLTLWLGIAAASFLLATVAWAALVLPVIRGAGRRG